MVVVPSIEILRIAAMSAEADRNFEQCDRLYERLLRMGRFRYANEPTALAEIMIEVAEYLLSRGRSKEAIALFEEAITTYKLVLGEGNQCSGLLQSRLSKIASTF